LARRKAGLVAAGWACGPALRAPTPNSSRLREGSKDRRSNCAPLHPSRKREGQRDLGAKRPSRSGVGLCRASSKRRA